MFYLFFFIIFLSISCDQPKHTIEIDHHSINGNSSDLVFVEDQIKFGWQIHSPEPEIMQSAYQIVISGQQKFNDEAIIWDSGKIDSNQSQHIVFDANSLETQKDYYWRVKVWDDKKVESPWSPVKRFYVAPEENELDANWIGAIRKDSSHLPEGRKLHTPTFKKEIRDSIIQAADSMASRSIYLRKNFISQKEIRSAKLYISGLGHYVLHINGKKIGNSEFAPLWSDYDKTVYYNIYNVSEEIKGGKNAIGVLLGNGMYNTLQERYSKFYVSFGPPTLFLQLQIHYSDGSSQVIKSDDSWKYSKSPIIYNSIFGGEDYDANLEQVRWDQPDFNESNWKNVIVQDGPQGKLTPQLAPPVTIAKTYEVKEAREISKHNYVFNMGQNLSGFPSIKVLGKKGDIIRIWVGEKLNEEGSISQGGSGKPYYFDYILKSAKAESWRPQFSYYGYQYIQIENINYQKQLTDNLPTILEVKSHFIHNSAKKTGNFESSNELFNKTHQIIGAAIRSNFQAVFTDCPHREKLGWLEETHLNGPGLLFNYDLRTFIPKVMQDMEDAQWENGLVPNIAPEYITFGGDFTDSPEWGVAVAILPWMYYEYYGDSSLIEEYYSVMKNYVDYLTSTANNHIVSHGLGDWYDFGEHAAGYSKNSPIPLSATSHYYFGATKVAKAAILLGKSEDAETYQNLSERIKQAFNREFFDSSTNQYGTGSQFSNAVSLYMDLVDEENRKSVFQNLLADIEKNGYRLTTGDVGNRYLYQTLAENEHNDVMYKLHNHYETPGYGFQIQQGMTTLTEQWDPRKGNSLNHFMMGQIEEWFYKSLAGIQPDPEKPGFKHFYLQPEIVGDLSFVNAEFDSIYGKIVSKWEKTETGLNYHIAIPENTTATIHLPIEGDINITVNGKKFKKFEAAEGKASFQLGSGDYKITVQND